MQRISILLLLILSFVSTVYSEDEIKDIIYDGMTTYCWAVPLVAVSKELPKYTTELTSGVGTNCPLSLVLKLHRRQLTVGEYLSANWKAGLEWNRLHSNALDVTYYAEARVNTTGDIMHLISNVAACESHAKCDPFTSPLKATENDISIFRNNSYEGTTTNDLKFFIPGDYTIMAHVILPSINGKSRFEYVVYDKVSVTAETVNSEKNDGTESTSSWSDPWLWGVIACGALLVLALVVAGYRRRQAMEGITSGIEYDRTRTSSRAVEKRYSRTMSQNRTQFAEIEMHEIDLDIITPSAATGYTSSLSKSNAIPVMSGDIGYRQSDKRSRRSSGVTMQTTQSSVFSSRSRQSSLLSKSQNGKIVLYTAEPTSQTNISGNWGSQISNTSSRNQNATNNNSSYIKHIDRNRYSSEVILPSESNSSTPTLLNSGIVSKSGQYGVLSSSQEQNVFDTTSSMRTITFTDTGNSQVSGQYGIFSTPQYASGRKFSVSGQSELSDSESTNEDGYQVQLTKF